MVKPNHIQGLCLSLWGSQWFFTLGEETQACCFWLSMKKAYNSSISGQSKAEGVPTSTCHPFIVCWGYQVCLSKRVPNNFLTKSGRMGLYSHFKDDLNLHCSPVCSICGGC